MKNIFREIKIPFYSLLFVFIISVYVGWSGGQRHPKEAILLFDKLYESFSSLKNINIIAMFFYIFVNNAVKSCIVAILGALFGIIPVVFIAINGILIGLLSSVIVLRHSPSYLFAGTLPHGLLEIPAFLIAASYGLQLGKRFYRKLKFGEPFKQHFFRVLGKIIKYVFPLLAVASFIETFITMTLLRSL